MSAHYKQPILLIEFEEHKSFSLQVRQSATMLRVATHTNTAFTVRRSAT